MADTDLSDTSDDEEQLTSAQKSRDTRARSRAEEEAAAQKLVAETEKSGGRQSKKDALEKKVWSTGRKRTVSSTESVGAQKSKKAKATQRSDEDDMQVDTVPARKPPAKRAPKSDPKAEAVKSKSRMNKGTDRSKRSSAKIPKAAGAVPAIPSKQKQKAAKIAGDNGSEIDNSGSQSRSDDGEIDEDQQSGDEGSIDLDAERPRIILDDGATNDDLFNFGDLDIPKPTHHRRRSSSSSLSMAPPPETDYDDEIDGVDGDATSSGMEDVEDVKPHPAPKRQKTAQQVKYEQEQPKLGASRVVHAQSAIKPKVSSESDWDPSARIIFPTTGGGIKLLEQAPLLKAVLTDCITLATYELAYKDGYQPMPARDAFMSRLIRRVAKKKAAAVHIERRAKKDMKFCQRLAHIVLTRVGNVRNDLRNAATSKVATLYELNKAGITPSQIKSIVKQLFADQRYILPYAAESSAPVIDAAADAVTADNATVPRPPPKILKAFVTDKPFFAPIIIELIRETWWSSHKALGFKHVNVLKSNRKDRPTEVVLPDSMICLAGANAYTALQAWQTGVYIPAPEFSQGRLESTYQSLIAVMEEQRTKSPKIFNKLMHDLYLAVAKSPSGPSTASGSANNVISLAIDSD
ncbi:hypothetical protein B0H13DRAFT_2338538 [Mycena leptocephala]|nr:hypothetical protein B0H13DRAFT_2338538 [Mycena leptocephala]